MPATTPPRPAIGIAYLDGRRLRRAMSAGLRRVIDDQEHLNKINVFPVADGDTGTNLALTMSSINGVLAVNATRNAGDVFMAIADAAIDGARGNSGAIVAQFLQGLSDSVTGLARITARRLAQAVKTGESYARDALAKPVEGTVLTVMGDFADRLLQLTGREGQRDFVALWGKGVEAACRSLEETPQALEVLRKAGVVDAGAEGFVRLLQGIHDFICNGEIVDIARVVMPDVQHRADVAAGETLDLEYRYCTECMVTGHGIDRRKLKETLMEMGGSLVLAGTHSKTRIHIHVNDPNAVFRTAAAFGTVSATKADDMQRQQDESHRPSRRIAIVMDSAGDIPDEQLERAHIHMIPVRLHFGRESYLDKVTITTDEFYARLAAGGEPPKTSQPAPGDFRRDFQFLASHYEAVICISLLASVSGTYQSALTAAGRSGAGERIYVIDSGSVSVGQGLLALYAADCVEAGYAPEAICDAVVALRSKTPIYAFIPDLTAVVRGGRVSAMLKRLVDFLHLTPVLGIRKSGQLGAVGWLPGRRHAIDKMRRFILRRIDPAKCYRISIAHANCENDARRLLEGLKAGIDQLDATYFSQLGSALGAHAGVGTIATAVQEYVPAETAD